MVLDQIETKLKKYFNRF